METLLLLALSNALAAIVLAVLASLFGRLCRRPAVRHALWLLVLLKLITPPLLPFSLTWSSPEVVEAPPAMPSLPSVSETAEPVPPLADMDVPAATAEVEPSAAPLRLADVWLPLVVLTWLGGSLAWWTLAAVRLTRFRRLLAQVTVAPAAIQEQARRLAGRLGVRRCPPVALAAAPLSPMLWALGWTPRLLLPATLWHTLDAEQQDTLLAHELAHLRRGDHWIRRLEFVVLGLYWWHPVVWWARRRLQEAEEECCDALVVTALPDAAAAYAAALVETVAFLSQTRAAAFVGASGAGQVPLLKRRLTMILNASPARRPSRLAFWTVLVVGALLLPLAPHVARTETPQERQSDKTTSQPIDSKTRLTDEDVVARPVPVADEMRNCVSCHKTMVPAHDFHGKPQSWREAHNEVVRLMDEVNRRRAQLREAARRLPAAQQADHREEIEQVKDAIELLKVQVRVKEAHLKAVKTTLPGYQKRLQTMMQLIQSQPGAVSREELEKARLAVATQEAELTIKEAELQEPLVRLKQAERRLARLQKPAEGSPASGDDRLKELEHKLESLQKEIRELRHQKQPDKPREPQAPTRKESASPPRANGLLAGRVIVEATRQPIKAVLRVVNLEEDDGKSSELDIWTDQSGYFTIPGLKVGCHYELIARAKDGENLLSRMVVRTPPNAAVYLEIDKKYTTVKTPLVPTRPRDSTSTTSTSERKP